MWTLVVSRSDTGMSHSEMSPRATPLKVMKAANYAHARVRKVEARLRDLGFDPDALQPGACEKFEKAFAERGLVVDLGCR